MLSLPYTLNERYRLDLLIGQGGFGSVYRSTDLKLGREVAVKLLYRDVVSSNNVQRFIHEAQLSSQLTHFNLITIYDFGETEEGLLFIVTELLRGLPLSRHLRLGPLTPRQSLTILSQLSEGLHVAHEQGIIHRDIKPGNIFLEWKTNICAKLIDFGIAKALDHGGQTQTQSTFGTPHYMSPEQIQSTKSVTSTSDIYSLGVVLFECLEGDTPHQAEETFQILMKHINEEVPPIQNRFNLASESFDALQKLLSEMTDRDLTQRISSALEVHERCERILKRLPKIRLDDSKNILLQKSIKLSAERYSNKENITHLPEIALESSSLNNALKSSTAKRVQSKAPLPQRKVTPLEPPTHPPVRGFKSPPLPVTIATREGHWEEEESSTTNADQESPSIDVDPYSNTFNVINIPKDLSPIKLDEDLVTANECDTLDFESPAEPQFALNQKESSQMDSLLTHEEILSSTLGFDQSGLDDALHMREDELLHKLFPIESSELHSQSPPQKAAFTDETFGFHPTPESSAENLLDQVEPSRETPSISEVESRSVLDSPLQDPNEGALDDPSPPNESLKHSVDAPSIDEKRPAAKKSHSKLIIALIAGVSLILAGMLLMKTLTPPPSPSIQLGTKGSVVATQPSTPVETPPKTPVETPPKTPVETPPKTPVETPPKTPPKKVDHTAPHHVGFYFRPKTTYFKGTTLPFRVKVTNKAGKAIKRAKVRYVISPKNRAKIRGRTLSFLKTGKVSVKACHGKLCSRPQRFNITLNPLDL